MASVAHALSLLDADFVVFAGDMVDERATQRDMRAFAQAFAPLRGKLGTLSVPGNHEHLAGFEMAAREIRESGIPLLRGGHWTLERSGGALTFLGVDDPGGWAFDPPQD
jgi:predicted MPP superfamily phosphohydrolase